MSKISTQNEQPDRLVGQVADELAASAAPALSAYELARRVFVLLDTAQVPDAQAICAEVTQALLRVRLLTPLTEVSSPTAYLLFGKAQAAPAEMVCSLDPFAYLSHLSAMEYHGLTDRFPKILYFTRPAASEWRKQAALRMEKDLGERWAAYEPSGLPRMLMPKITALGSTVVQFAERSQLGAFRRVAGSTLRVATLGRVFLDMLREPALCGGIQHVIDIYRREAARYLSLILDELDRHGQPIDKVRAGYLLTEVCQLETPAIAVWAALAQRGGSRKLDPEGEYAPHYSERWQLSINVPSLTNPQADGDA